MYLWKVKTIVANAETGGNNKIRHIITSSKRAEDAYNKARMVDLGSDESLQGVEILGSIPSIAESSPYLKPIIFYVLASYVFPDAPSGSSIKRVPSGFSELIDTRIGQKIGIDDKLGPIATDPAEPVDTSKLAVLIAISSDDIEQARMLIASEIFLGQVSSEDIYVLNMRRIGLTIS